MNQLAREHLDLNPDEQRPLYRSPAIFPRTIPCETLQDFKDKHPDWQEREREYQKRMEKQSDGF